ncbi:hypothetical protein [Aquimarina sp. RZ0]|uniref:hypothetical protein n=1 Tax=Aquimarina sp. RZ0 TaxID=2607730 RepID=UPI0011F0B17D|nr:hypothetical protein [Aquimarina sp. RZ0]KAA1243344.1 hypothetical protein F0000_21590 [Aquimarina sp. RZ0]
MSIKKGDLYKKIFKQGLIYEADVDDLSQSLMSLFEQEILEKEEELNKLSLKKELLKNDISPTKS